MKIIIITQEDSFAVPQNIARIIALDFVTVQKIVNIDSSFSLVNQKKLFIEGFGYLQAAKMGFKVITNKIVDNIDRAAGFSLPIEPRSLESVARKNSIPYQVITNPNDETFLKELATLHPDVIVSYSAPVVFREKLLNIAPMGCINLHCSYLPHFAGVMPSFWALYKKQKSTGVTVHYMDSKIDNGQILGQKEVPISSKESIFSLILKTKKIGGELMCEVLQELKKDKITPIENNSQEGSYFSWPKVADFKDFKNNGGRLI